MMSRSALIFAASVLVLGACQPSAENTETPEAETPPVVVEEVAAEDAVEPETEVIEIASSEADDDHEDHDESHEDHADEAHDHDDHEGEDHDDHDHDDHAEDAHDHDGHDHEEDDHDHAGGEAHVHGLSDLAVSLEGSNVIISLEGALANFGLDETIRTLDDTTPYTDGSVELVGGDCTRDTATASIRPIGDHGNLMVDLSYTCAAIDTLTGVDVIGFANFSGFEEVNAVVLTDVSQTAETLTTSKTVLDLP